MRIGKTKDAPLRSYIIEFQFGSFLVTVPLCAMELQYLHKKKHFGIYIYIYIRDHSITQFGWNQTMQIYGKILSDFPYNRAFLGLVIHHDPLYI